MSLLLLKTRDLTWQDHTLNTEVMLAPARSGLLLNKHKTLGAKCEMDKQLYERQRTQCIKDFLSSRRLIDRQRQKLICRQRELGTKEPRVKSAVMADSSNDVTDGVTSAMTSLNERSASAPGGTRSQTGQLPAIYIDTGTTSPDPSDSSSFFVTEVAADSSPLPSFAIPSRISLLGSTPLNSRSAPGRSSLRNRTPTRKRTPTRNKTPTRNRTPPPKPTTAITSTQNQKQTGGGSTKSPPTMAPRLQRSSSIYETGTTSREMSPLPKTESKPSLSVRFNEDQTKDGDGVQTPVKIEKKEVMKDPALEAKVKAFIADIDDFTIARRLGKAVKKKVELWPGAGATRTKEVQTPLVAKRYNTWQVDQAALLSAFDQFCNVKTPEELTRAMRLASKIKANIKVTRNQSIVPSIAAYKSTRAFKALIKRDS